jgi:hypothetical protein
VSTIDAFYLHKLRLKFPSTSKCSFTALPLTLSLLMAYKESARERREAFHRALAALHSHDKDLGGEKAPAMAVDHEVINTTSTLTAASDSAAAVATAAGLDSLPREASDRAKFILYGGLNDGGEHHHQQQQQQQYHHHLTNNTGGSYSAADAPFSNEELLHPLSFGSQLVQRTIARAGDVSLLTLEEAEEVLRQIPVYGPNPAFKAAEASTGGNHGGDRGYGVMQTGLSSHSYYTDTVKAVRQDVQRGSALLYSRFPKSATHELQSAHSKGLCGFGAADA